MSFEFEIFKKLCDKERNVLVSPMSIMYAFAMTANGADGNTLQEMLNVLAHGKDLKGLNDEMKRIRKRMSGDKNLKTANGIWVNSADASVLNDTFTSVLKDSYNAEVNAEYFDEETKDKINSFVKKNTAGMIPKLVEDVKYSVIVLVNALAFKAEWQKPFDKEDTRKGVFKNADKSESTVDFMNTMACEYVENEKAEGFVKAYKGGKYSFMAIKPKGNNSLKNVIKSLDDGVIADLLENAGRYDADISLPKFEVKYDTELKDILPEMGMKSAFDGCADFSNMTKDENRLYISKAIHKTHIKVDERGTKAAAATAILIDVMGIPEFKEIKRVVFNRPFAYFILDENQTPVFMGKVEML